MLQFFSYLFIFLCQVQIWTWPPMKLLQRKRVLLLRWNRKLQWERKYQLATWRKPSVLNSQCTVCKRHIFKTQRTENTVRKTDDFNISKRFFLEVGEKNWITIPSLFFLIQLEFVYHADDWTVHSKLYVHFFYFTLCNWQMPDCLRFFTERIFQSLLVNHLKYLSHYIN